MTRMRVRGESMRFLDNDNPNPGSKIACELVRDDEFAPDNPYPATDAEICQWSPEQYRTWKQTGRKPTDEQTFASNANAERFARASDRKNGIDSGRLTADQMAAMSPIDRFVAASAARNRLNPHYQDEARRRRRD